MVELVAALDANLLFPIASCDFLLTAFDHDLFEPVVSAQVLTEVERNLIDAFPDRDPARLRARVAQMAIVLTDQIITDIDASAEALEPINAKDRHVAGAALEGQASILATDDLALRREVASLDLPFEALSGNAFVERLCCLDPGAVADVIEDLAAKRARPPVTPDDMRAHLAKHFPCLRQCP